MTDGVRRVVLVASIAYIDVDGLTRRADHSDEITVHVDDVVRFDSLNGSPAPKLASVPSSTARTRRRNRAAKFQVTNGDSDGGIRNLG